MEWSAFTLQMGEWRAHPLLCTQCQSYAQQRGRVPATDDPKRDTHTVSTRPATALDDKLKHFLRVCVNNTHLID